MATNFFFRHYENRNEQRLLENLAIEAIQIYGEDVMYIPRNLNNYDIVYSADDQSSYTWAIPIEMYIKSYQGFSGDGSFMSKYSIEIHDQITFTVAMRRFMDEIGSQSTLIRPREGDLIYFPLNDKCFQIKAVSKFEQFYQLGALQTWEMTCELFEYSDERFSTGVPEIDKLQVEFNTDILGFVITTQDGYPLRTEDGAYILLEKYGELTLRPEDEAITDEASQVIDFDVDNPFADITDTR